MAHIAERIDKAIADTIAEQWALGADRNTLTVMVQQAVRDAGEPDPLRELAEWLVAREELLPEVTTTAAETLLAEAVTRAREALGRTEEGWAMAEIKTVEQFVVEQKRS